MADNVLLLILVLLMVTPLQSSSQVPCTLGQDSAVHQLSETTVKLSNDGTIISAISQDHANLLQDISLWVTGIDLNGSITSVRDQQRNDWQAGLTDYDESCIGFERIHHITTNDMETLRQLQAVAQQNETTIDCGAIPESILTYPADGNPYIEDSTLASLAKPYFRDVPEPGMDFGDGVYDPCKGDFPIAVITCSLYGGTGVVSSDINEHISEISLYTLTSQAQQDAVVTHFTLTWDCAESIHIIAVRTKNMGSTSCFRVGVGLHLPLDEQSEAAYSHRTRGPLIYSNSDTTNPLTISSISYIGGSYITQRFLRDSLDQIVRDSSHMPIVDYTPTFSTAYDTTVMLRDFSHFVPVYESSNSLDDDAYQNLGFGAFEDGTPITYGGVGYDTSSVDYASHAFSGTPYDQSTWTTEILQADERPTSLLLGVKQGDFHLQHSTDHIFMLRTGTIDRANPIASANKYIDDTQKWLEEILPYCNRDVCSVITNVEQVEHDQLTKLRVWPNPAQSKLVVDGIPKSNFVIYNLIGQTMLSGQTSKNGIDISTLHQGLYVISIENPDHSISSSTFIKQ